MSYTNQDNTASTGVQGGKYGSNNTDQFDSTNTNRATGGAHFGDSGDPNTFSNVGSGNNNNNYGSGNQPSDDYGSSNNNNNQSSGRNFGAGEDGMGPGNGTGGVGTRSSLGSTVDNNNMGASGLGGAGNRQAGNVGGPGAYGTAAGTGNTRNNNDNLNSMDDSGNTMAGAGEGFAAGTGTSFANDRDDTTARDSSTYGNYTGGDANAPPAGFRGGANDPAYQPGQHWDHKSHAVVPDSSEQHGRRHHNDDDNANTNNNTSSTGGRTLPLGNTSGGNDNTYRGSNDVNNDSARTGTRGENWQSGETGLSNTEKAAVAGGVGGGALYGARDRERHGAEYGPETGYGPVAGSDTRGSNVASGAGTGYVGDADAGAPMGGNNVNNGLDKSSNFGGGNTYGVSNNQSSNTGPNLGKPANTTGGGEGWQSGLTGLTEDEARAVQQGLHARSAVEAHPNPSQMESYGGVNNNDL